jgi:hypothetical protein
MVMGKLYRHDCIVYDLFVHYRRGIMRRPPPPLRTPGPPTRLERFLLSVLGPPSIGDPDAPYTLAPDPARDLCPKCHLAWAAHTVIRPSNLTLAQCPEVVAP